MIKFEQNHRSIKKFYRVVLQHYNILDWFITTCTEKQQISRKVLYKKSLPRLVGESPDRAVDRLNYTLDQGVIPNRGGVT